MVFASFVILLLSNNPKSWSAAKRSASSCSVFSVCLGVFDPSKAMKSESGISVEHIFVEWQAEQGRIENAAHQARELGRTLMVTIEPWPWWRWEAQTRNRPPVLNDVVSGLYDSELNVMCSEAAKLEDRVYLRWGHEMEDTTGRYPWAGSNPATYIAAYRYFVSRCRRIAPKALFVWSPIGKPGLAAYYPGDEVVDYVGLSLYASEKVQTTQFGKTQPASGTVAERYYRVAGYEKPILFAELGVAGSAQYLETWFLDFATHMHSRFPLVSGIFYFNETEPFELPEPFGAPDWRVGAKYFSQILGRQGQ